MALCLLPAAVNALTQSQITLDQESGGQPTRFTFEASSDANAKVSALSFAFPPGFDLAQSTVDAVTQDSALVRIPVKYTVSRVGQTVTVAFDPPLTPGIDVQVKINNVMTPARGGTYPFGVSYVADGVTQTQTGMSFSYASSSGGEQIAYWLDAQPWVAKWNSVPFLNLFLQPQYAVLAFTTVWVGWLISLALVALAFPIAIVGGLGLAFMKMAKIAPIRWIASAYINVIRGTPLFLQIAIAFVGLPIAGLRFPWFPTGVVVLALNSSAYLAEIFRAGIQSINKGQFEAASSLGMSYPQSMQYVVIPQTVKRVLPTMTSEFILLFKDTALLSAVGVFELMLYSNNIVARSGNITPFMVAAVFYLIVTIPLINYVGTLERKLAISEGGQVADTKKERQRRLAADVVVDAAMPKADQRSR
jgi:polar amino acid transport system substrate-binding protein